jgi:glucose-6-phosphate dehydrogenase assembly protein OpcA
VSRGAVDLPARPVDVAAIERELARLWRESGAAGRIGAADSDEPEPVTRACMSNLLVFAPSQEAASQLPLEIAEIVERHPARVLLLVGEPEAAGETGGAALQASVSAMCHLAGGGRRICSEHVTLSAPAAAQRRLPSTARALLVGDLPTALWWVTEEAPPVGSELFQDLAGLTDHVIWDSARWVEPARGVMAIADFIAASDAARRAVTDLTWRRGKAWRFALAELLDPATTPGAQRGAEEVTVEYGPYGLAGAWLLAAWLATRLDWTPESARQMAASAAGESIAWRMSRPAGAPPVAVTVRRRASGAPGVAPELLRVDVAFRDTAGARSTLTLVAEAGGRLAAKGPGAGGRIWSAADEPRYVMVARQLAKRSRDPIFRDAAARARAMAGVLAR